MSDDRFIQGILTNDRKIIQEIYDTYLPKITALIQRNSGNANDAWEIFQEGLILIYQKAKQPGFKLTSAFYTYLYGVCRMLWSNELRKKYRGEVTIPDNATYTDDQNIEKQLFETVKLDLFKEKFQMIDGKCKQILELFFNGIKFKEIAKKLEMPSEGAAKKKKHGCQHKLISLIKSDSRYHELKYE